MAHLISYDCWFHRCHLSEAVTVADVPEVHHRKGSTTLQFHSVTRCTSLDNSGSTVKAYKLGSTQRATGKYPGIRTVLDWRLQKPDAGGTIGRGGGS